ncbi:hypothetical protein [Phocaeicola dorei]|uniref:hypothetical protein n=1 Tax=Phocaeicola dorei TaxID=357276 RepID=UPI00055376BB|nr:hypothetical protein [Phocaeicola dorei]
MERRVITISENGRVDIPSEDVWMSEMELVELFGVVAPTLRAAIKAIYKNCGICPTTTRRCDVATPVSWATFYNLEVIIALAFRLDTYEAERIRQKVLECVCQRKENAISLFVSIVGCKNSNRALS